MCKDHEVVKHLFQEKCNQKHNFRSQCFLSLNEMECYKMSLVLLHNQKFALLAVATTRLNTAVICAREPT